MCDLPCGVLVSRFKRVILGIVLNCTPQISHVGFQNQIVLCSVLFCAGNGSPATSYFTRKVTRMHQHHDATKASLLTVLPDINNRNNNPVS